MKISCNILIYSGCLGMSNTSVDMVGYALCISNDITTRYPYSDWTFKCSAFFYLVLSFNLVFYSRCLGPDLFGVILAINMKSEV